jgi:hypothetical protein
MNFDRADEVEYIAWSLRWADFPRSDNRALLNNLYNGSPPYTPEEQKQSFKNTNVNFLEGTEKMHDGRRQLISALTGGNNYFTVNVDYGPAWKRREWSTFITNEINKKMRASRKYLDCLESCSALQILHGVGPCTWRNKFEWCPVPLGIEDVLVPSNTLTSMDNVPVFVLFRQYTFNQLYTMTHGPKVDPAWNMELVEKCLEWVTTSMKTLSGGVWSNFFSAEKASEFQKQNSCVYASDTAPTVDVLDCFFWCEEGRKAGWRRRMILDGYGTPGNEVSVDRKSLPDRSYMGTKGEFLYNSENRKYSDKIDEIIHFQFADCSCVAPFRYHSVRSLGFLLYNVCHLQNRLRCKFNDSVFESLLQYFRVADEADYERLTKIDLIDKGVLPPGLEFVPADQRWQVPAELAESLLGLNRQSMSDASASYSQDFDFDAENSRETATRTMAKVNSSAALVGSMLTKTYNLEKFKDQEICRRFCISGSPNLDVKSFRVECFKRGIPEEALNISRWEVQPVRIIGSGNKTLQVAMADKLMAVRQLFDASGQKIVDKIYVLANSDDPALPELLVPDAKTVSEGAADAQNKVATILKGLPAPVLDGSNHVDYIEAWIHDLATLLQGNEANGGMATADEIKGYYALEKAIQGQIEIVAQNKAEKGRVAKYGESLAKMMNIVKAYAQRLQEQKGKQQAQAQPDPVDQAKVKAIETMAATKSKIQSETHAQRTAQKQIAFEQQIKNKATQHRVDILATDVESAAKIRRGKMAAFSNEEGE